MMGGGGGGEGGEGARNADWIINDTVMLIWALLWKLAKNVQISLFVVFVGAK